MLLHAKGIFVIDNGTLLKVNFTFIRDYLVLPFDKNIKHYLFAVFFQLSNGIMTFMMIFLQLHAQKM